MQIKYFKDINYRVRQKIRDHLLGPVELPDVEYLLCQSVRMKVNSLDTTQDIFSSISEATWDFRLINRYENS